MLYKLRIQTLGEFISYYLTYVARYIVKKVTALNVTNSIKKIIKAQKVSVLLLI